MGSNLKERYENLRKSVNIAIKRFCNKIETMNGEMKQCKEEIIKGVKKIARIVNIVKLQVK